jgi:hypothetical protein
LTVLLKSKLFTEPEDEEVICTPLTVVVPLAGIFAVTEKVLAFMV